MGFVSGLLKIATGVGVGIATVAALPVLGAVGTVSAAGAVVGSVVGGVAGAIDAINDESKS
jgi:hypothetical protein